MEESKVLEEEYIIRIASKTTRLANFLVDTFCFLFFIYIHSLVFRKFVEVDRDELSKLWGLYFFALYVLYYTLFEFFLRKTPGKFLSRTHVVTSDWQQPKFLNLLGRNLCRLIPWDKISFLFSEFGWHDKFSKTRVVDDAW